MKNKVGIIYRAYLEDGRSYIGQTIQKFKTRINDHKRVPINTYFYNAIKKYGFDAFKWEILEECNSREELDEAEKKWIKHFNSFGEGGFNLTSGGYGQKTLSNETLKKISESSYGENNNKSKLTWEQVREIRKAALLGVSTLESSKKYNVSKSTIIRIIEQFSWKEDKIEKPKYYKSGLNAGKSKLTWEQVREIRKINKENFSYREISEIYNISINTARYIITYKTWKYDPLDYL